MSKREVSGAVNNISSSGGGDSFFYFFSLTLPAVTYFVAGAASASLVWWCQEWRRRQQQQNDNDEREEKDGTNPKTWSRYVNQWKSKIIGEFPGMVVGGSTATATASSSSSSSPPSTSKRRRSPWPWNRRRRTSSPTQNSDSACTTEGIQSVDNNNNDTNNNNSNNQSDNDNSNTDADNTDTNNTKNTHTTPIPPSIPLPLHREKTGLCIGSIFGLDVGGTLAKLVYFEQKPNVYPSRFSSHRQWQYAQAAAARAVLAARRGRSPLSRLPEHDNERHGTIHNHNNNNNTNSGGSSGGVSKSNSPINRRRRQQSFVVDDDQQQQQEEAEEEEEALYRRRRRRYSESFASSSSLHSTPPTPTFPPLRHSMVSNQDLQPLFYLRQESLPDDLEEFASTVDTRESSFVRSPSIVGKDMFPGVKNGNSAAAAAKDGSNDKSSTSTTSTSTSNNTSSSSSKNTNNNSSGGNMKRCRSMFDMSHSRDHAEALDRFYNFARRLDSYREGVRDTKLSFYSRELGGEFHFIRFETRRMTNAMDLIRANQLHVNICEMGATGGGAHKYAPEWDRVLGIRIKKQDELESLVAGMQFVLSTVVGECYTFLPREGRKTAATTTTKGTAKDKQNKKTNNRTGISSSFSSSDDDDEDEEENDSSGDNQVQQPPPVPPPFHLDQSSFDGETTSNNKNVSDSSADDDPPTMDNSDDNIPRGPKMDHVGDEWWWSRKVQRDAISYSNTYPYLLVTIGTGVSILRVDGPRQHERISGSTIGGGTYWGLIRLLTDVEDFEDVMRLAERGDPSKVDMMVGDIYGKNSDALEKLGLSANLVASSFGKLVAKDDPAAGLKQEDLARALLLMVTNNIGQVAYLNAKLHHTPRIYFVGNFLRHNKISQRRLSYAINYWSKGEMEALFLEHEGYFGALGAFLLSQGIAQGEHGFFQWGESKLSGGAPSGGGLSTNDLNSFNSDDVDVASVVETSSDYSTNGLHRRSETMSSLELP